MTEFELIGAYQEAESSWQSAAAIFFSVLFSFLVAVYLVGPKLTRFQVVIVTLLYTFFCLLMVAVLNDIFIRMRHFSGEIVQLNPERNYVGPNSSGNPEVTGLPSFVLGGGFLLAYVASLVFMFQIRRNARKRV